MALWKRGRRYWTLFKHQGELYRIPLRPPGESLATTSWHEATRLEKAVVADVLAGKVVAKKGVPRTLFKACESFLEAKRATANRERTVEFLAERLEIVKGHFGDVALVKITRDSIEGFQAARRADGRSHRTINMDLGALRQVLKRYGHWRRLEDQVTMLTEAGHSIGQVIDREQQLRLFKMAQSRPEWEHVYCAALLANNTSMRGVEVKNIRRKDVDLDKEQLHIRHSKNETSVRVIPLNAPALEAVLRMLMRADALGHTDPGHYLWCASQHGKFDPTKPAAKWDTAWRNLRAAADLPKGFRFHDLRHTVITELLESGEPDHVIFSITGQLSKRMLEHYSHIRNQKKRDALDRLDETRKAVLVGN